MLRFYARRAIPGSEDVACGAYRRTIRQGPETGVVQISSEDGALRAEFWLPTSIPPDEATARLWNMFDLGADLTTIYAHLSCDPTLSELMMKRPALRIPGGWNPCEVALRTVLGQQISVAAACVLAARLVERCGEEFVVHPFPGLARVFPTPQAVAAADLSALGMPGARANTLKAVAEAFLEDPLMFQKEASAEETVTRLRRIKGVGEWTAHYIAIRACREFDAFPVSDVGILRGLADGKGARPNQADLLARAEAWRPYRAYAAQHVWAEDEAKTESRRYKSSHLSHK